MSGPAKRCRCCRSAEEGTGGGRAAGEPRSAAGVAAGDHVARRASRCRQATRRPHAFLRVVPKTAVAALHDRLQDEGIHLAAAFAAAAVHAADALPGRTEWTGIVAPTDVRADCAPEIPGNAVGEYVAGISLLLGPEHAGASLLETARELQDQFLRNRPPSLLMDANVPNDVSRDQVDQMAAANDVFGGGVCVSDVGDFNRLVRAARRLFAGARDAVPEPRHSSGHGRHRLDQRRRVPVVRLRRTVADQADAHAFADRYLEALGEMARSV